MPFCCLSAIITLEPKHMKVSKLTSPVTVASLEKAYRIAKQSHDDIRAVSISNGLIQEGKARKLGAKGAETLLHKSREQKAILSALGITPSQLERESDYVALHNALLVLDRLAAKYPASPDAPKAPEAAPTAETPNKTPIMFASDAAAEFAKAESMTDAELRSITPKRDDGRLTKGELVALHAKRA